MSAIGVPAGAGRLMAPEDDRDDEQEYFRPPTLNLPGLIISVLKTAPELL